jgi:hypothetical protein
MIFVRRSLCLTILLAAGFATVGAQEHPLAPDRPGSWSAPDVRAGGLPPDVRTSALAAANQIVEIIRRMPAMAPANGFQVVQHTSVVVESADGSDNPRSPKFARIEVSANLAPYERTTRGVEVNERDTAGSVTVVVNSLSHTGTMPMGWQDEQGGFIQDPEEPLETRHGFPVYQEGNLDKWLFMRRHDVPIVTPVTRERYLRVVIARAQDEVARVEERRAKVPAGVPAAIVATIDEAVSHQKTRLANLQQQLRSMTADERRSPAVVGTSTGDEPVAFVGAGDGSPIVSFTPALMDPKLPPATPQVISVRITSNDDLFPGVGERLDQQLDWAALNKVVH